MRPNIDISWSIHGQIKDYAENNENLDLSGAYEEIIEKGLENIENPD